MTKYGILNIEMCAKVFMLVQCYELNDFYLKKDAVECKASGCCHI